MVSPVTYVREVIQELRKVTWPTLIQTRNMTILVIVVSLLVGIYVGVLDFVFSRLVAWFISL